MLQLNEKLFKSLSSVLRMTYKEISSQTNIAMTTLYRIIETPSKISVQQLLDLANGLCVPVSRFFSKDSKEPVGEREDYIEFDHYKLCFYDKGAMQKVINSSIVSSYREIASVVGLHPNRVKESLLAEHRLPVTRLLKFCDALKMDYSFFIVDPNSKDNNAKEKKNVAITTSEYETILHELVTLRHEMELFRAEFTNVRRSLAHLDNIINLLIDTNYEDITAVDEVRLIAARAKQIAKESQSHANKQLENEEVISLPTLKNNI